MFNAGVAPYLDIFDGTKKFQILKIYKYRYDNVINEYEKTILTSIQETNDALYNLKLTSANFQLVKNYYDLDFKDLNLVAKKINYGVATNIDLFRKKEELLLSEKQKVNLKIDEIISFINIYKALGGIEPYENI